MVRRERRKIWADLYIDSVEILLHLSKGPKTLDNLAKRTTDGCLSSGALKQLGEKGLIKTAKVPTRGGGPKAGLQLTDIGVKALRENKHSECVILVMSRESYKGPKTIK
jgi:DNA-binding PadR family transcriptional regulator